MIRKARSLVLGGNGFIGSHLCEHLADLGHQVICFDHFKRKPLLHPLRGRKSLQLVKGDFRKTRDLNANLNHMDYVFHFVSVSIPYESVRHPEREVTQILLPTLKLLELCVKHKVKKIIYPSSGGLIYGPNVNTLSKVSEDETPLPLIPHAVIKLAIEQFLYFFYRNHGLNFCSLRLSNVYGPRAPLSGAQGIIGIFMNEVLTGKRPVVFGNGQQIRDYLYVHDAVKAIALAAAKQGRQKIYNVGSGIGYSVLEVLQKICAVCGETCKPAFAPDRTAAISRVVLDNSGARKDFGWKPNVTLDQGLRKMYEWIRTAVK